MIQGENQNDSYDINKLRKVDFEKVESLDPSLEDGFKFDSEKSVPMTIELDASSQMTHGNLVTMELITIRILLQKDELHTTAVRFELMSEEDVQFYY